ncbi:MAG: electron transfer flavoprotein beta subunit/FixA family protein [Runella slithyformis]|nr:MAG: electron transfer flavoprotein beta subunit/FixA family protein [Runella slithyformis]TAF97040.1 MAG: electron transfer flavoprotein beta subunit/FixA family protein [Runella sp.]TAG21525.1 MAG: electron transfer flavoprotein beta subunit/FixA family protein [Cytophagales bacterium]TAG40788.1 MAG: electron transfer flavoprotein beta subunit/FixA family protein [Cytophagia bacterium]TAE95219.1 MAG: electron transfer flavoprotein beta subunit/FixA family protein [Runella slithyformis]
MKILVCITNVPDTTAKIAFIDNDTKLNKAGVQYIIGPYDDYALARAVELKEQHGGSITVLNVGEADGEQQIRKALAIGADDAIRVNCEPSDSYFVAAQIAHCAKEGSYDLILMGRESIDFNSGVVHGLVGEMLNIPSFSPVMKLDIDGNTAKFAREIEGGKEYLEASLPLVLGCQEPIAEWKIPNMRGIMTARTKPLNVVEPVAVPEAATLEKYTLPAPKGAVKMIAADDVESLIALLKSEAKVL